MSAAISKKIICLMGPTACGKTDIAIRLLKFFPFEIVSVDSAMVYRDMDIGTAKPSAEILATLPHHLINIRDPRDQYSVAQFCTDATVLIDNLYAAGKIPLLVGGSMLYFRGLQQGLAFLPAADLQVRNRLNAESERQGWPLLHTRLREIDPDVAQKIHPHDGHRIQRALEVYELTGVTLTAWQQKNYSQLTRYNFVNMAILPTDRKRLHTRIAERFLQMLADGFIDEVQSLRGRGDLTLATPAMKSVGYRQLWDYLAGTYSYEEMVEKGVAATRQLAKRQMTWLRRWPQLKVIDSESEDVFSQVVDYLGVIIPT